MKNWKLNLNQLATDYWCEVGNSNDVLSWLDLVNSEEGEIHPYFYDLYDQSSKDYTAQILRTIAKEINGFEIESWESEPFAKRSLFKALELFIAEKLTVQDICNLTTQLDGLYNIGLAGVENPNDNADDEWWLGNLWNCCDWCDDTWNHGNSQPLVSEAKRIYRKMANK